jgi:hypothetical protein
MRLVRVTVILLQLLVVAGVPLLAKSLLPAL